MGACTNDDMLIPCDRLFDLELPEGRCIGLQLHDISPDHPDSLEPQALANPDHWTRRVLHPEEVAYAREQPSENRRTSFVLGRLALRQGLGFGQHHLSSVDSILKDEYGRPNVPPGFLGSISHKGNSAVALVTVDRSPTAGAGRPVLGVGVDLEDCTTDKSNIATKVLTRDEIKELGNVEVSRLLSEKLVRKVTHGAFLQGITPEEEVLLRFSIKESLYKAMHPLICQFVSFQEVQIQPRSQGNADIQFQLKSGAHERFGAVTAHWRREGGFFLSSCSVRLKEAADDICET
jgi:enterobactin synthetase component D